jgi:putative ABC transport system substrate-binding protein
MNRDHGQIVAGSRRRVRTDAAHRSTRRKLLLALCAGALASPLACLAQSNSKKIPRIGFLEPGPRDSGLYSAFVKGLQELGYVEGKNILIEARFADGAIERLPAMAKEMADSKPDVIVIQSTPGVRAMMATNTAIPIVMVAVGDPVANGFVASLAKPGGRVTGMSTMTSDVSPKLLEMLKSFVPKLSRVAVLVNPANANSTLSLKNIQAVAGQLHLKIVAVEVPTAGDIDKAFGAIAREHPGAILIPGDPLFRLHARQIADLALRQKLPVVSTNPDNAEAGGLLSYGPSFTDIYRRSATYVDKILKGAKPGDIPVEQPTKIDFIINRKTTKALGLTIPQSLLIGADKVIE